jgi:hypothetical protein
MNLPSEIAKFPELSKIVRLIDARGDFHEGSAIWADLLGEINAALAEARALGAAFASTKH